MLHQPDISRVSDSVLCRSAAFRRPVSAGMWAGRAANGRHPTQVSPEGHRLNRLWCPGVPAVPVGQNPPDCSARNPHPAGDAEDQAVFSLDYQHRPFHQATRFNATVQCNLGCGSDSDTDGDTHPGAGIPGISPCVLNKPGQPGLIFGRSFRTSGRNLMCKDIR